MHEETETGWFMPDWTVRDASLHGCNNRLHNSVKWDALWLNGSDALILTKCASSRCRCSWQGTTDRSSGHLILTEYPGLSILTINKIRKNNLFVIATFNPQVDAVSIVHNWNMKNNSMWKIIQLERLTSFVFSLSVYTRISRMLCEIFNKF